MDNYDGYVKIGTKIDDKDLKPQLQKTKTNILSTMKTIGIGTAAAAAAVAGFVKIAGELNKAYMVQASAERALATAAKNNPYLNDRSIQRLKAYASELQKVSNYGDEVTIGLMAQLAAAGRTEAEIQKIIKASADLAASGTTTFDGAVRNLNKTFSGLSGELGEVIPELKNLTAEQMKNGDAVDLIAKKYDGMALSVVDKSVQAKKALGDLSEQMGRWLSPVVDWLSSSFGKLAAKMAEVLSAANDLRDAKKAVDEGTGTAKDKIIIYKNEIKAIEAEMKTLIVYDELGQKIYTQAYKDREEQIKQIEEAIKKAEKQQEIEERLAHAKSIGAKDAAAQAEKELAIQKEADEKERKQIEGRIAAQQQYEAAVNLATEKQKGGLITLEEKWDDIKSAAEDYTDALINLGYTYEETATIGGKALEDMRRKLIGDDLSKGLKGAGNEIGFWLLGVTESFKGALSPIPQIAFDIVKQTKKEFKVGLGLGLGLKEFIEAVKKEVKLFSDSTVSTKSFFKYGKDAIESFLGGVADKTPDAILAIKDFTKNVASSFAMGLSIAKNVVSSVFTAIKALATFSPGDIVEDIKTTFEGLTEFFTVELPLLPVYFASGATIIREFLRGMIEELPNTTETIKNVLTEIFDNIKDNIEEDTTSALTVASALLLAIIKSLPQAIKSTASIALALAKEFAAIMPSVIKEVITSISGNIGSMISEIFALAIDSLINSLEFAPALISAIVTSIPALITGIISSIPTLVAKLIEAIPLMLVDLFVFAAELWVQFLIFPAYIWVGIIGGVLSIVEQIIEQVGLFFEDPKAWIEAQKQIGKGIGDAIINSLKSVIDRIGETVSTLIDAIVKPFKGIGYEIEKMIGIDINGDGVIGKPANGGTTGGTTGRIPGGTTPAGGTTGGTTEIKHTPPVITTPPKELPTAPTTIGTGNLATESRQIKVLTKILGVPTEFASEGNKYNAVTLPIYLRQKGLNALQIAALLTALKQYGVASYATGTSFAEGGLSQINEPYSELVELPTGSKVMTANATAGLVEQAVQSVMRGLGGFEGQQNQRPIVLHNYMESVMNVNGKVLGKIAFENIDRNVRMQYGS